MSCRPHGFFYARRNIDFGVKYFEIDERRLRYANVPYGIGAVLSARLASSADLATVLGVRDLYDLLEVLSVDNHNASLQPKK